MTMSRSTPVDGVLLISASGGHGGPIQSALTVARTIGGTDRVAIGPWSSEYKNMMREIADVVVTIPRPRGLKLLLAQLLTAWHACVHRRRYAVIHANSLVELIVAIPASVVTRRPIVAWVHNYECPRSASTARRIVRAMRRRIHWAAVSELARDVVVDNGLAARDEVELIPNPIDPTTVKAEPHEPSTTGEVRIGYLGTDRRYKGFDLLPDCVSALGNGTARWLLFSAPFATDHASWQRLVELDAAHVECRGRLMDVRSAYGECDIVFIPSRQESFCRVAAEAMVNGIPVVASDLSPLRELLGDDDAGILFPVADTGAATRALRALIEDSELRRRLGAAGQERALRYLPSGIADQMEQLYRTAKERRSTRERLT